MAGLLSHDTDVLHIADHRTETTLGRSYYVANVGEPSNPIIRWEDVLQIGLAACAGAEEDEASQTLDVDHVDALARHL